MDVTAYFVCMTQNAIQSSPVGPLHNPEHRGYTDDLGDRPGNSLSHRPGGLIPHPRPCFTLCFGRSSRVRRTSPHACAGVSSSSTNARTGEAWHDGWAPRRCSHGLTVACRRPWVGAVMRPGCLTRAPNCRDERKRPPLCTAQRSRRPMLLPRLTRRRARPALGGYGGPEPSISGSAGSPAAWRR
jgi:hypothetical protein